MTRAHMAAAVASTAVEPALQLRLEAAAARGDSRGTDSLLHATARLIARMPRSCPAELKPDQFQQVWSNMAHLLGRVCCLLGQITQPLMEAEALPCGQLEQQQQQRARSLLPALHAIAPGLRALLACNPEQTPPAIHAANYCCAWKSVLDLPWLGAAPILTVSRQMQDAPSQYMAAVTALTYRRQDLADWCTAASAAVRALPLLAQAERLQRQAVADLAPELHSAAAALARNLVSIHELGSAVCMMLQLLSTCSPSATGSQPPAAEAMWQLHSAGCRVIHWAESSPDQAAPLSAALMPRLKLAPLITDPLLCLSTEAARLPEPKMCVCCLPTAAGAVLCMQNAREGNLGCRCWLAKCSAVVSGKPQLPQDGSSN